MSNSLRRYRAASVNRQAVTRWSDPIVEDEDGFDLTLKECHTALVDSQGLMAKAAMQLRVPFQRFQRVVQVTPVLFEVVLSNREGLIDEAEASVRTAVRSGDALVSMQVLRTVGKHRGWTEKDQVGAAEHTKIEIEYINDWRKGDTAADAIIDALPEVEAPPVGVATETPDAEV